YSQEPCRLPGLLHHMERGRYRPPRRGGSAPRIHGAAVDSVAVLVMSVPTQIKGRYEIRQVLGQGGMGVVYNAYDTVVKRSVALKTVRDAPSRTALDLFYKECDVLASISHPNIVEIFDLG